MREVISTKVIKVGDRFKYKGVGTISGNAIYDALVITVTPHTVTLLITIDQDTLHDDIPFSKPMPYTWTIVNSDLGKYEHLYVVGDLNEE